MSEKTTKWWENDPYADKMAIGVVLHKIDGQWVVARALLGSPAEKAGLTKGDVILAVDGNTLFSSIGEGVIEATLTSLREGDEVEFAVLRSRRVVPLKMSFELLSGLLQVDDDLGGGGGGGGGSGGYCLRCRNCSNSVIGVVDCSPQRCEMQCLVA